MFQPLNKMCPKCRTLKPVDTGFGWRKVPRAGGTAIGPQSWCYDDRGAKPTFKPKTTRR